MTLLRDHDLARAFDHASHTYDGLTALNPGYRTGLLRSARRLALPADGAGLHLLDLGCGTGASTRALLRAAPRARSRPWTPPRACCAEHWSNRGPPACASST